MKNALVLSGRLPLFEGKYTPANGDKKSRMNWAMNVQLSSKNEQGYNDEVLMNFTAWGYYADQLNQISSLSKDDPMRKEFTNITVTGRLNAGYKNKEGDLVPSASVDVSEFEFIKRLPSTNSASSNNVGDAAFAPSAPGRTASPAGAPIRPGTGAPTRPNTGAPARPGTPALGRGPARF